MHGPSLAETTAFVAVVELKSFTKAAKQLALSPPRVSEMVRNLEDRLGVRLVERTTRSVAPTAAGERLLARLRPALDEYQAALESTNEFRGKPAGTLRLTAPQPVADFFLAYVPGPRRTVIATWPGLSKSRRRPWDLLTALRSFASARG